MKRRILTFAVTAVVTTSSGVAWADAGPPGSTFPEQPGDHAATACATIATNPGTGLGGVFEQHAAPRAIGILTGNYIDACLD